MQGDSKYWKVSKLHYWFKSYSTFAELVDFAYWWSFISGGSVLNGAILSSYEIIFYAVQFSELSFLSNIQYILNTIEKIKMTENYRFKTLCCKIKTRYLNQKDSYSWNESIWDYWPGFCYQVKAIFMVDTWHNLLPRCITHIRFLYLSGFYVTTIIAFTVR